MVLSGSTALEASSAPGLSFRQFVDALARCGLLCFCGKHVDSARTLDGGLGGGGGVPQHKKNQLVSAAERVQAMFVTRMRLLDSKHVDARLQQLVHPTSATNHGGEAPEEGNGVESIKQRENHGGHAAGAGCGHVGKKKGGGIAHERLSGGPRGGGRKAAADPKPASVLAPIQTTPRGRETLA